MIPRSWFSQYEYTQSDDIRHNLVQAAGLRASTRGQPSPTIVNTRKQTEYESETDKSKRTIAAMALIP